MKRIQWHWTWLLNPPLIALIAFYSLVFAVRLAIGFWPHYAHPDPGSGGMPFPVAHDVVAVLLIVGFLSGPIAFLCILFALDRDKLRSVLYWSLVFLGWSMLAIAMAIDPGAFFNWFFD